MVVCFYINKSFQFKFHYLFFNFKDNFFQVQLMNKPLKIHH